jgi:hypothetical protein
MDYLKAMGIGGHTSFYAAKTQYVKEPFCI